ncbi:MAG: autotransporter outer membrane beta-barrel domain-containing protein [Gallionella sp.]
MTARIRIEILAMILIAFTAADAYANGGNASVYSVPVVSYDMTNATTDAYISASNPSVYGIAPVSYDITNNNVHIIAVDTQITSIQTLMRSGLNSVMFGAHHRTLLDNGLDNTGTGYWVTGDLARHDQNNADTAIGEFGLYKDILPELRLGAGFGINQVRQGMPVGGNGKLNANYLVLEGDYRPLHSDWSGSATIYLGSNRAHLSRGYLVGPIPNISTGSADGSSWAIRLRSDWSAVTSLNGWAVSPYLAYTHAENRLNGYAETGGLLPFTFGEQRQTSDDVRAGATFLSRISEHTDLRFPLELIYRNTGDSTVTGVTQATPFSFINAGNSKNWGRAGVELDHRISEQTVLNSGALFASRGGDSSWLITASLKHAF